MRKFFSWGFLILIETVINWCIFRLLKCLPQKIKQLDSIVFLLQKNIRWVLLRWGKNWWKSTNRYWTRCLGLSVTRLWSIVLLQRWWYKRWQFKWRGPIQRGFRRTIGCISRSMITQVWSCLFWGWEGRNNYENWLRWGSYYILWFSKRVPSRWRELLWVWNCCRLLWVLLELRC